MAAGVRIRILSAAREQWADSGHKDEFELRIPEHIAEETKPREVEYKVYWSEGKFAVVSRMRDGRYATERGPTWRDVSPKSVRDLYEAICENYGLARDPLVPIPRQVSPSYRFSYEDVWDIYLERKFPKVTFEASRARHESRIYTAKYLHPMRVLANLGLVRFGTTSWRLA